MVPGAGHVPTLHKLPALPALPALLALPALPALIETGRAFMRSLADSA